MPVDTGSGAVIASRQNLDGGAQRTTEMRRRDAARFPNLYALNADTAMGNKKAAEIGEQGRAAYAGSLNTPGGQLNAKQMADAYGAQEQANAWADPTARAGQIQKQTGLSPVQSQYASLYMGASNNELGAQQKRYGNLTGLIQNEAQARAQRAQELSSQPRIQAQPGAIPFAGSTQNRTLGTHFDPNGVSNRGSQVQGMTALNDMERRGLLSGPERQRAESDPAYYQELLKKYGYT